MYTPIIISQVPTPTVVNSPPKEEVVLAGNEYFFLIAFGMVLVLLAAVINQK